ncbi:serine hydrolase [Hyphomonas oceanitis]|nr:serine hydrolase domain-containing protein [Hyphomonas oceanitis]
MTLIRMSWRKASGLCAAISLMAGPALAQDTANCPPAQGALPDGYDWSDVEDALDNSSFLRGALIIYHKGDVAYWGGFGGWSGDDTCAEMLSHNFNVASLSKTMTAAIALSETGDTTTGFSLDDLVKEHITDATTLNSSEYDDGISPPEQGEPAYDHMTIGHLMSMTTGHDPIQAFPLNPLSCINNTAPLLGSDFETCGEAMIARAIEADADPNNDPDYVFKPGDAFSYGPMAWQILGLASLNAHNLSYTEDVTFTELVEHYLTGPDACNLPNTVIMPEDNEWPAGGFETDLFDGGVFAQALLSGQCNGKTLLTPSSLNDMRITQAPLTSSPEDIEVVSTPAKKLDLDYARGLWVYEPEDTGLSKLYLGVGAFGAIAFFSPDRDWAAYIHLNDQLLTGYVDATELIILDGGLGELIDAQADANP